MPLNLVTRGFQGPIDVLLREGLASEEGCVARGLVVDSAGDPLSGVHVTMVEESPLGDVLLREAYTDDEGGFSFVGLAPGKVRIDVQAGDGRRPTEHWELPTETTLRFRVH